MSNVCNEVSLYNNIQSHSVLMPGGNGSLCCSVKMGLEIPFHSGCSSSREVDKLEGIQGRATEMIKRLERLIDEERLQELNMYNLAKRMTR